MEIINKKCTVCEKEKTLDLFCKQSSTKDGKRPSCKECDKIKRNDNKEQKRQYHILHKDNIARYQKEYLLKNKQKIYAQRKDYYKKEKVIASQKLKKHIRRSITKNGDVSVAELLQLQNRAKFCYWCNCDLKKVKVHIDHYVPLSKGGEHTLSNLVVSCQKCNCSKNAKDPLEFANSKGKLL